MAGASLSLVVVVEGAPRQAENALRTLSAARQRNVTVGVCEVICVERPSSDPLGSERAAAACGGIRYVQATSATSLWEAARGAARSSSAPYFGFLPDAANLVTPRLFEHALLAFGAYPRAVVAVPAYHVGREPQTPRPPGEGEALDRELLASVDWQADGYSLFTVCTPDPGFKGGYLAPFTEAGCLFASRECLDELPEPKEPPDVPADLSVYLLGGLTYLPRTRLVVLASEGTFHQYHECPATFAAPERRHGSRELRRRFLSAFGAAREPVLLGAFSGHSLEALRHASYGATMYHGLRVELGKPDYPDG
ncbi:MAG TPA: hypothetical protein VHE30_13635 [Polyangiaceae bacterium]|nr:hypothetical protein [Polyangiaceae bacterium]